jgi:hypothetical protein
MALFSMHDNQLQLEEVHEYFEGWKNRTSYELTSNSSITTRKLPNQCKQAKQQNVSHLLQTNH